MRTTKMVLKVDRRDVSYLRWTIESYDGIALVSTLDPALASVEIQIAPGCESIVTDLLKYMAKEEGVDISCLRGGFA